MAVPQCGTAGDGDPLRHLLDRRRRKIFPSKSIDNSKLCMTITSTPTRKGRPKLRKQATILPIVFFLIDQYWVWIQWRGNGCTVMYCTPIVHSTVCWLVYCYIYMYNTCTWCTCLYMHVLLVNSADCVLVYVCMYVHYSHTVLSTIYMVVYICIYVHCLYTVLFTWWCTSVCTYTVGGTVYVVVYVSMYLQSKISFVLFQWICTRVGI